MNPNDLNLRLELIKKSILVIDLETSSLDDNLKPINIHTHFEEYLKKAKIRWVGCFSYRDNKSYLFNCNESVADLFNLISSHKILVAHNGIDFDIPILKNNEFLDENDNHIIVDTMVILGKSSFHTKDGYPFKQRGVLMNYDFESNSLRCMAKTMGVETQKGDISYEIFNKFDWTKEEIQEIKRYLLSDVMATKEIFDILWTYWKPFTQFLPLKSIDDLSWTRGSIASVIYKSCCHLLQEEPTYADKGEAVKEEMGGNVLLPAVEEARNVWYVDYSSLYPHLMVSFNLFAEVHASMTGKYIWHGNEVFKVKGYYDCARPHPLSKIVTEFLKKRMELKKTSPDDPMVYTLKIWLNGLYGIVRSSIFEKVHKPSAGWDTCSLGQQCQKLLIDMMNAFGFDVVYGDTDSGMFVARDEKNNNEPYVKECLKKVIEKIFANAPFRVDTFGIAIEHYIDYILFPYEEQAVVGEDGKNIKIKNRLVKERKGKKKNYTYIWTDKDGKKQIEVKGLPIIKGNATTLGLEIYEKTLKEKILTQGHAKFPKSEIENIINDYLKKPNALEVISQEYKVKPAGSYKTANSIQSQISKAYFGGGEGVIRLIKNNLVGSCGKGNVKYCSIPEAQEAKLTVNNLDLTKLWNELMPFVKYEAVSDTADLGAISKTA